jgi:hypothetical protein
VSALLLRNGDFVACVYKGLVDDYARSAVRSMAAKVVKSGRKKFSKLIIDAFERKVSAWDYYCYGLVKGNAAFTDKFISDFLRMSLLKQVDALPEEKRRLIEISACNFFDIDEATVLDRDAVVALVHTEVEALTIDHGRSLTPLHIGAGDARPAIPAELPEFA